jgi:NAD(P)-dependent dehydrogenase (short-subunit alcohol dehydrogenase family)
MNLKGKVVVVTGAAGGIGRALSLLLAREGARLVLTDIRKDKLLELKEVLAGKLEEATFVEHDVTSPNSWDNLMNLVSSTFGWIDILVNNAGVVHPGMVWELPLEKINQQVSVNLLGTMLGCRSALALMRKQNHGRIVNLASLGGIILMPGEAVYCATKFAIRAYSLCLAAELHGTSIKVSVVCPDSVDTPQLAYELLHDEAVMSFLGEPLPPEKVARKIIRAATGRKTEVLVPAGRGMLCRLSLAFPGVFFLFWPLLRKMGRRGIHSRRSSRKPEKSPLLSGEKEAPCQQEQFRGEK